MVKGFQRQLPVVLQVRGQIAKARSDSDIIHGDNYGDTNLGSTGTIPQSIIRTTVRFSTTASHQIKLRGSYKLNEGGRSVPHSSRASGGPLINGIWRDLAERQTLSRRQRYLDSGRWRHVLAPYPGWPAELLPCRWRTGCTNTLAWLGRSPADLQTWVRTLSDLAGAGYRSEGALLGVQLAQRPAAGDQRANAKAPAGVRCVQPRRQAPVWQSPRYAQPGGHLQFRLTVLLKRIFAYASFWNRQRRRKRVFPTFAGVELSGSLGEREGTPLYVLAPAIRRAFRRRPCDRPPAYAVKANGNGAGVAPVGGEGARTSSPAASCSAACAPDPGRTHPPAASPTWKSRWHCAPASRALTWNWRRTRRHPAHRGAKPRSGACPADQP